MQRPSGVKLWQHPLLLAMPSMPFRGALSAPEDVQAASYLAASASIESLDRVSIGLFPLNENVRSTIPDEERVFAYNLKDLLSSALS